MTTVYSIDRVAMPPAPKQFADSTDDVHFVPAPCQVACPIGTDAPSYIAHIWEGEVEKAFEAITATNPFSSICGRVCDAPCEPACRRVDSDGAIAIRNLKRYVMEKLGASHKLPVKEVTRSETIAIVGGGPAGLTAAHDLADAGFAVDVYEQSDRLGGMMAWGIPAFRLPQNVLREDIDRMLDHCPGITVHTNTGLGSEISLEELKQRHDVVLMTIGAWIGKSMPLEGSDNTNVIDGVGFLREVNGGARPPMPETVVVVGGGDVAMDACRAALRLPGCKKVKVLYRRGPDELPARLDELEGAIKEGIELVYHTQPVAISPNGDGYNLTCISTELGEPNEDGRRRPVDVPGSEHDIFCGKIILAVGQKAESEELDRHKLMDWDRVRTDWDSMRTQDAQVFAAGDGAFGGSTIVMAMQHGHRAAYYIKAHLDGVEAPMAYRTPFRTRAVKVADDAQWEIISRHEQEFHGVGAEPVKFLEIETTYTDEEARREAARCYRCDAETGSTDYSVRNREDIFVMARTKKDDALTQQAIFRHRLENRDDPFGENRPADLQDLVFLPANLSRLVIDPYRDACSVNTDFCSTIKLDGPFMVGGFDTAPDQITKALDEGLRQQGAAYVGTRQPAAGVRWVQLITESDGEVSQSADALLFSPGKSGLSGLTLPDDNRPKGLTVIPGGASEAVVFALENDFDFLMTLGNGPAGTQWSELSGAPDLTVLRDIMRTMRAMNREEDLDILYFGGVRTGTDAAKLIGLGANVMVLGTAMGLALGGQIAGTTLKFDASLNDDERIDRAKSLIGGLTTEASIMARCTGKTNIHNIEPEDLRSITLKTAECTGIPLAGAAKGTTPAIAGTN